MAVNKTQFTEADVNAFIAQVPQEQKRNDSYQLIILMEKITGEKANMYGPSIIGFGKYHYRYDSGHEGEAPLIGFSPRKAAISLYIYSGDEAQKELLKELGKYKMGKACIYIHKLSHIDESVLIALMKAAIADTEKRYTRL